MQNIHTYYSQFQRLVQDSLQKGLAPIEKHLKVSDLASRKKVLLLRKISLQQYHGNKASCALTLPEADAVRGHQSVVVNCLFSGPLTLRSYGLPLYTICL